MFLLKRWSRSWSYFTLTSALQPSLCCIGIVLPWSALYCARELCPYSSDDDRQRSSRREPQSRIKRGYKPSSPQSEGILDDPHCITCIALTALLSSLYCTILSCPVLQQLYCTILRCTAPNALFTYTHLSYTSTLCGATTAVTSATAVIAINKYT